MTADLRGNKPPAEPTIPRLAMRARKRRRHSRSAKGCYGRKRTPEKSRAFGLAARWFTRWMLSANTWPDRPKGGSNNDLSTNRPEGPGEGGRGREHLSPPFYPIARVPLRILRPPAALVAAGR